MTKVDDDAPDEIGGIDLIEHVVLRDRESGEQILSRRPTAKPRFYDVTETPVGPHMEGHVLIRDRSTGQILADQHNEIHFANMAEALALSLGNRSRGHIHAMAFGNGGSVVSGVGSISYFPPNVSSPDADLYSLRYTKVVDDQSPRNEDPENNNIQIRHTQGRTFADVVITCVLDYNEPSGQEAFDDLTSTEGDFVFDELGIKGFDPDASDGVGRLLTHVVFHPVQKSLNRSIEVIYAIRIVLG